MPGHVPLEGNQDATHVMNEPQVPQSQKSLKHTQALLETETCNRSCWTRSNIIVFKARLRVEAACNVNEISLQEHRSGCKDDRTNNREQKGQQDT